MAVNHSRRKDSTEEFQCTDSRIREGGIMASEYTPFCPRYCHRSVLGIRSANKYYIQACVLGKEGDAPMVRLIANMSLVNVASPRLIVAGRQVNMPAAW